MVTSYNLIARQRVERFTAWSDAVFAVAMKVSKNACAEVSRATKISKALMIALVSGSLLFAAVANAESSIRIVSFDSKVVVNKVRNLEVTERIEIANDDGLFDGGSTADCGSNQPAGNAPSRARSNPFKRRSIVK